MDHNRLRHLAGIQNEQDDASLDQELEQLNASDARREAMQKHVTQILAHAGLGVDESFPPGIQYDEPTNEVIVDLEFEAEGTPIAKLAKLANNSSMENARVSSGREGMISLIFTYKQG